MSLTRRIRNAYAALTGRSYEAAGGGRRFRGFVEQPSALRAAHEARGPILRRARSLYVNNALARSGVDAWTSAIVGSGIKLQSTLMAPDLREKISLAFERWTDFADADENTDFYGLQALVTTLLVRDGEAFVAFVNGPEGRLRLRVLDADQIDASVTKNIGEGGRIVQGVEFRADGSLAAYHLRRDNPGLPLAVSIETVRIPADQVLHIFRRDTAGQVRGVSWLSPCLLKLYDNDATIDAMQMNLKTSSLVVGVITDPNGNAAQNFGAEVDGDGSASRGMEPGELIVSTDGTRVDFNNPPSIGQEVNDFLRLVRQEISAALGIPSFALTGDMSEANFSSMRVGLIEWQRRAEAYQHSIISFQLLRPVWRRWLAMEVVAGRMQIPGFLRDPESSLGVRAIPPRARWVDPLKDAKAEILAIDAGLMSRREAVASRGYDIEALDREIAEDDRRAQRLGIDPNVTTPKGAAA